MERKCACCGGSNFLRGISLMDKVENTERQLMARADREPDALFLKGAERVDVQSEVCDDCGHVQLYIGRFDRETLKNALRESGKLVAASPPDLNITVCINCNKAHGLPDCPHCGFMREGEAFYSEESK